VKCTPDSAPFDFELRFYVPLDTKWMISETFFAADLLKKLNLAQQKQTFVRNIDVLRQKINTKN